MRFCQIEHGSIGNDAGGIDVIVRVMAVPLDVIEVYRRRGVVFRF
jgi:hypothetical protein